MLEDYARRYRRELLESVIPFWMKHSIDREHGGYFTCLDRQGRVYDSRKYVWLQGRQVWTLCRLYNQIERREEWLAAARLGLEFLRSHGRDPEGRYWFSLTREGRPAGYQRKPYAAVFAVIGMSEYYKATGDESALREAEALFRRIREWIAQPALLGRPRLEGAPAMRQLADLMVVASMSMELEAARHDDRNIAVMRETLDGIFQHYDSARRVLLENTAPDGTQLRRLPEGRLVCPGHSLEVAWFILHLLDYCPDEARAKQTLEIIEGALEAGWDREYGGLFYFIDVDGCPTLQLESDMKLWWPHTEALYALVLAATRTGEERWLRWLHRIDEYSFRTFADPEYGEWFGYCDRSGRVSHAAKGGNYKGCFHVPRFLLLCLAALEQGQAPFV